MLAYRSREGLPQFQTKQRPPSTNANLGHLFMCASFILGTMCLHATVYTPEPRFCRQIFRFSNMPGPKLLKPPSLLHCPGSCLSHSEITNTSRSFTTAKVALITGASGITGAAVLEYDSAAFEHLAKHPTPHFLQPLVPFKIILLAKYLSTSSGMILRKYIYLNLA